MTRKEMKQSAADHIARYTREGWLPAVWSEDEDELRKALIAELGQPIPSGYMSEECGWKIYPDQLEASR